MIKNVARTAAWLRECHDWMLANDLDGGCPMDENPLDLAEDLEAIPAMTVQAEPVAWKNYAEDGDWWLTDDREPADSCERSVPLYAFPTPPAGGSDGTEN